MLVKRVVIAAVRAPAVVIDFYFFFPPVWHKLELRLQVLGPLNDSVCQAEELLGPARFR